MKKTVICQGCWEQMHVPIVIRGPLSLPYLAFGIKKSRMHPNVCTVCESMFTKVKKHKQIPIPLTILFADIRGYTDMSQRTTAPEMNNLLHSFYDQCSTAVWEHDGIINKFIGDAVLAIFNFPLNRPDHVRNAVNAALELQKQCKAFKAKMEPGNENAFDVGIGIHTGECYMGEVGTAYKDFTAIGSVVNLTSRLQTAAGPGEIVVTTDVYQHVKDQFPNAQNRLFTLKGLEEKVNGYILI